MAPPLSPRTSLSPPPAVTPLPHPASGAPVPVAIVSASAWAFHKVATHPDHTPTGPLGPGLHRDFTRGNFTGGFDGPGLGSIDHFDPGPRRGPGLSMIHGQSVEPHVDETQLVAFESKLDETQSKMQAIGATSMAPTITSGNIDAFIAKLERAASLMAQIKSGGTGHRHIRNARPVLPADQTDRSADGAEMTFASELFLELLDQGIDVTALGVRYARRAYSGLAATAPDAAYSLGFLDGIRALRVLLPRLEAGPNHDPAEFWRRLYDPDVLPMPAPGVGGC